MASRGAAGASDSDEPALAGFAGLRGGGAQSAAESNAASHLTELAHVADQLKL
jgi:hypothetical protein